MRQETNWGYTRIMGECKKLGLKVSRQTVKNVLVEAGLPVGPKPNSEDSWDAFLARHAATLWQCDFVTKPMWTPRGLVDLYFLVFLHLGPGGAGSASARNVRWPAWVTRQDRNVSMHAEEVELTPEIVMRDKGLNDCKGCCQLRLDSGWQTTRSPSCTRGVHPEVASNAICSFYSKTRATGSAGSHDLPRSGYPDSGIVLVASGTPSLEAGERGSEGFSRGVFRSCPPIPRQ